MKTKTSGEDNKSRYPDIGHAKVSLADNAILRTIGLRGTENTCALRALVSPSLILVFGKKYRLHTKPLRRKEKRIEKLENNTQYLFGIGSIH